MSQNGRPNVENEYHKINLLLVDDQPNNLIALEAVLRSPEYNLVCVSSGFEAIEAVKKQEFALILLDVQMPGMDGFETARRIKEIEGCQDIPLIFISAVYNQDPFIKKGYQAGAIDYFAKPFDPEILKTKVNIYSSFQQRLNLLKEREARIKQSEELLEKGRELTSVLENLPVGALITDAAGRVIYANEEIMNIWGKSKGKGRNNFGAFLGWWDADGQLIKDENGPVTRALNKGDSINNRLHQVRCADGVTKDILSSTSPLKDINGNVSGVVVVLQDVSKQKKIQNEMEERIRKLISLGLAFNQVASA